MKEYNKIKRVFKKEGINSLKAEIVSCVSCSCAGEKVSDDTFNTICEFTEYCYNHIDKTYIQLLTDIICDLLLNFDWGYRNLKKSYYDGYNNGIEHKRYLTKKEMKEESRLARDMVIEIFYDKYYD